MKILMAHPHDLYSLKEPWTIRIKKIASEFAKKGHEVKVVYFPLDHRHAGKIFDDGGGFQAIAFDRRLGAAILAKNIARMIKLAGWCDIIHFQKCYHYVSLPSLIASAVARKPVHYDWDDWETKIFYYSNPRCYFIGGFIDLFEKILPRCVNGISVTSRSLRELCIERGAPEGSIFNAPVGADIEQFHPGILPAGGIKKKFNIPGPLVMYVGQLHGGQYAELFIKAARSVANLRPDVWFMVVGDGYRFRELKDLASRLRLDSAVIFTGAVRHDDVPLYLAEADVCVACFEDNEITHCKSPLKIVEYMAMGKAVVASNVGEVRRMLGGVGVLVEPGNPQALFEGILKLLEDEELRKRLGRFARKRVETRYTWGTTAAALLNSYEKISNNKRAG